MTRRFDEPVTRELLGPCVVTGSFGARLPSRANDENLERPGNNDLRPQHPAESIGIS